MRQTIRALGWTIRFLSIVSILLPITIAYSLSTLLAPGNFGVQDPIVGFSDGTLTLITPFYINNTGFYDITDLNLTVVVAYDNQTLSRFSEVLPMIRAKHSVRSNYTFSIDLDEILGMDRTLLTNDTYLDADVSASFTVAYAMTFGVSAQTAIPWGGPFNNLTVSDASYDPLSQKISVSIGFDNNADFSVNGNLTVDLYNSENEFVCSASHYIDVSPRERGNQISMELLVDDPLKMTSYGVVRVYFNGMFLFEEGWGEHE